MYTNRYTVGVTAARGIAEIGREAIRPRLIRRGLDARVSRLAIESLERIALDAMQTAPAAADAPEGFGLAVAGVQS